VGYIARKRNYFDDRATRGMISLLLKVFLPGMIISAMYKPVTPQVLLQSMQFLLVSLVVYILLFLMALIVPMLLRAEEEEIGVFKFMTMFSNVGFMGYPVLQAVYGDEAIFFGAVYNMPFSLLIFTVGVLFLTRGQKRSMRDNWALILNPGTVAVIIGLFLFITSIPLPEALVGTIKLLGDMTPPFSMIIVGAILAKIETDKMLGNWRVYAISLIRLLLIPLFILAALKLFTDNPLLLGVPVIIAAMPAAANTPILAEEYGGNGKLGSQGVLISTLLSVITIPVVVMVLMTF
jgi:hypothetical protein